MKKKSCSVESCERVYFGRGFCVFHYRRNARHGDPLIGTKPVGMTTLDRLLQFVDKTSDEGGCWLWTGTRNRGGYGDFRMPEGPRRAHRLAYENLVGPIPEGLELDHLCRVRNCVNPQHLEPVTRSENARRQHQARRESARAT